MNLTSSCIYVVSQHVTSGAIYMLLFTSTDEYIVDVKQGKARRTQNV
jgi:hypothetical protein